MKKQVLGIAVLAVASAAAMASSARASGNMTLEILESDNTTVSVDQTGNPVDVSYSGPALSGALSVDIVFATLTPGNPTLVSQTETITNTSEATQTFYIYVTAPDVTSPPPGTDYVQDSVGGSFQSAASPNYSSGDSVNQTAEVDQGGGNTTYTSNIGFDGGPTPNNEASNDTSPATDFTLAGSYDLTLGQEIVLGPGDIANISSGGSVGSVPEPTTLGFLSVAALSFMPKGRKSR